MRSRMVREGSVGLLVLAGLGIFGLSIAWLKGFNPANRSYEVTVGFPTIAGVQSGSSVRYRGVTVGRITDIQATNAGVDVKISIAPADLVIPANTTFGPGESKVFVLAGLNATDSDIWLYRNGNFALASSIITGLKYGPVANVGRTTLAASVGLWPSASAFVPAPAAGQSLQPVTIEATRTTNWLVASTATTLVASTATLFVVSTSTLFVTKDVTLLVDRVVPLRSA